MTTTITPHHPRPAGLSFACYDDRHVSCTARTPERGNCECPCHGKLGVRDVANSGRCQRCDEWVPWRTNGRTCPECIGEAAQENVVKGRERGLRGGRRPSYWRGSGSRLD